MTQDPCLLCTDVQTKLKNYYQINYVFDQNWCFFFLQINYIFAIGAQTRVQSCINPALEIMTKEIKNITYFICTIILPLQL